MFIDVNYNKRPKQAKLHLAKPNKRIMSHISEKFNDELSLKLGNINELSFSIPHIITDEETNQQVSNPHVELIKEKMLIKVTLDSYIEWYIVDSIEEDGDDSEVFNVKAFSLGQELSGKRISGLEMESTNATNLLTEILKSTVWKIGEVDAIFDVMFRSFESGEDSNALDCIIQAVETFGALIVWNTQGRKVSFKDMSQNGRFRGMTVDYGKFLNSIKRTRTTDEMVTRMYVYGNEGLSIHSVNPTGMPYIEDFSYFMYPFKRDVNKNVIQSSYFMSDELCNALIDHESLITEKSPQIKTITDRIVTLNTALITEDTKLTQLKSELNNTIQLLDVAKATEDNELIVQLTAQRDAKQIEVNNQSDIVEDLNAQIILKEQELETLRNQIDSQSNFTAELMDELNLYIIEKEWKDDRYIDVTELYNDAVKRFNEVRQPKVVIEANIENLLNIVEEQYYWDKMVLGDLIKVKYSQMNIEYMAKIIEIKYDLENGEVSLTIANTTDLLSDNEKLIQLLYQNSSASSLLKNNKYKWDKVNAIDAQVSSLLTSEWDATKNKIIAGVRNSVEVGNRGIIIRNPDFPDEVVIMQSGVIALSKDNGETWKTAIKPDGIVAERLIGQIIAGNELIITNRSGSFTMDNNGMEIEASAFVVKSGTGVNLVDRWQNSSNFVDEFKDDALITPYEKKMLKIEWDKIQEKYDSNIFLIDTYFKVNDVLPELLFITTYNSKYQELHDYLFVDLIGTSILPMLDTDNMANTTRIDREYFDAKFSNFNTAQVEVEKQISIKAKEINDETQRNINEVMDDVVYKTELHSTKGNTFFNGDVETTIYAVVYRGKDNITSTLPNSAFKWKKYNKDGVIDTIWTNDHNGVGNTIIINKNDVDRKAIFWCDIEIL